MGTAENIKRFREAQGFTKAELARRAGMTPTYLGQLEKGTRDGTKSKLTDLAQALGRSYAELVAETPDDLPVHGAVLDGAVLQDGTVQSNYAFVTMVKKRGSGVLMRSARPQSEMFRDLIPLPGAKRSWFAMPFEAPRTEIPSADLVLEEGDVLVFDSELEPVAGRLIVAIQHAPPPWDGPIAERPPADSRLRVWLPQPVGPALLYKVRPDDRIEEFDPELWTVVGVMVGLWRAMG